MKLKPNGKVRNFFLALFVIIVLGQIALVPRNMGSNQSVGLPLSPNATPLKLNVTLNGIGASFPAPLLFNWTAQYHKDYPNTTITYQSKGSGAGQNALFNKTSDFSASDAPLNANQRLLAPNVLHIPETVGSVVLAYNLPERPTSGLNFTGPIIASIYLGTISKWNDPAIQNINPGVALPNQNIITVHRSDSSGTTFVFTSYLSLESNTWKTTVGAATSVTWPGSPTCSPLPCYLTGNGNAGVAAAITSNSYAIGYVELTYALNTGLPYANLKNPAGNFITPSLDTTNFAVGNSTTSLPTSGLADWSKVSLLDAAGSQTYPLASFTYLLVYRELNVVPSMNVNETAQANALINFLKWAIHKGQTFSSGNHYVPLHPNVVAIDDASIVMITYTIKSTPVHRTYGLSGNAINGWNNTSPGPGPAFSIFSNDTIALKLSAGDTNHQFFVDFNNNNAIDNNETSTQSNVFGPGTPTVFSFNPQVLNRGSFPKAGTFTYRCKLHPTTMFGSFTVNTQQSAGPFLHANTLTSSLIPVVDSSRVSLIGSLIIDNRANTVSGNVSVVAVDSSSGVVTLSNKFYLIPNLPVGKQFILNVPVLPYDLGPIVTSSLTPSYSLRWRELDFSGDGIVNIVELATVGAHFGATVGGANYLGQADLSADGTINIIDLVTIAVNFQFSPAYH